MTEQDKCVRFKNGLCYDLMIQVAPHQERGFETLVKKAKIMEESKHSECENSDKAKTLIKKDVDPTVMALQPIK